MGNNGSSLHGGNNNNSINRGIDMNECRRYYNEKMKRNNMHIIDIASNIETDDLDEPDIEIDKIFMLVPQKDLPINVPKQEQRGGNENVQKDDDSDSPFINTEVYEKMMKNINQSGGAFDEENDSEPDDISETSDDMDDDDNKELNLSPTSDDEDDDNKKILDDENDEDDNEKDNDNKEDDEDDDDEEDDDESDNKFAEVSSELTDDDDEKSPKKGKKEKKNKKVKKEIEKKHDDDLDEEDEKIFNEILNASTESYGGAEKVDGKLYNYSDTSPVMVDSEKDKEDYNLTSSTLHTSDLEMKVDK